ncbi:MAG: electron transfer flavoprotein-ubiquinone oxidoreductase [Hyphomicrobiales bacterium]|nr:MAG: electron transfer flavoprotein-ubiquinone oxidoreductase [Hyphomicrobiales bacterium]
MSETGQDLPPREAMDFDVVIVGAGPAGLSAAIRLKQLAAEKDADISVVVLEKGSEAGAHILSGAIIDPSGIAALFPDWKEQGVPLETPVTEDRFYVLTKKAALRLPNFLNPPFMSNHGCHIASLGNVTRWLAEKAEAMGVEIYPGFAGAELLFGEDGGVVGVATGDMGVGRNGAPKDNFMRGMELRGKYTLLAEGARGSLSKIAIARFGLDKDREPQKYGLGLKELWQVDPARHRPGLVQHSFGWPLDSRTGGGSFLYHFGDNLVAAGFVVHLNYPNPYLSPYDEFQRFKTHPGISPVFEGGTRIAYGARALSEGGYQSVPKLTFPGGALVGCAAGFMNVPRIKGSHNAVLSGMMAAEAVAEALGQGRAHDEPAAYQSAYEASAIARELKKVRNVKPLWSRFGTWLGIALGGFDMWCNVLGFSLFGTLAHGKTDAESLGKASDYQPIDYPKPDGSLTFDKLSSVYLSATAHEEDQPVHLKLKDPELPVRDNLPAHAGPSQRYCPAGVYEFVEENGQTRFQINAANCVHCKTCDIKDPAGNITWTVPEGGGGPNYPNM